MKEIERRFLLTEFPARAVLYADRVVRTRNGFIVTDTIVERIQSKRVLKARHDRAGVTYYRRTIKIGHGIERFEFEDKISMSVHHKLWPITKGRRLEKLRASVLANFNHPEGLVWEIDSYLDRELAIAEVEIPMAWLEVRIPEWLAPYVVREITEEKEYEGVFLAKSDSPTRKKE